MSFNPYHYAVYRHPKAKTHAHSKMRVAVHPLVFGSVDARVAFANLSDDAQELAMCQMKKIGDMVTDIAAQMGLKPPNIVLGIDGRDPMNQWFAGVTSDRKANPTYRMHINIRYIKGLGALGYMGQARDVLCFTDDMLRGIIGHELAHIKTKRMGYEPVPSLKEEYRDAYDFETQKTESVLISNQEERTAALQHNHSTELLMDVIEDQYTGSGKAFMAALALMERDKRECVFRDGFTPVELANMKKNAITLPTLSHDEKCKKRSLRTVKFNAAIDTHPSYPERCNVVRHAQTDHKVWVEKLENEIENAKEVLNPFSR